MLVRVLKDTTLTAKVGSTVIIDEGALRFLSGRVEVIPESAPEPKQAKEAKPKKKAGK